MRMPLKGLAIGDGLCDPRHQLDYGDFLYQVGLLDEADRDLVQERTELAKLSMELQQWHQATDVSVVCIGHVIRIFCQITLLKNLDSKKFHTLKIFCQIT